jgi:uncharacterized membrane protein
MSWTHITSSGLAAFLASLVEFVEALTIVLAVGTTRGWKSALAGTALGVVFLAALVVIFGATLLAIPLHYLQLVLGILLLLFGLRWLRKAILRSAGVLALHDEEKIFLEQSAFLKKSGLHKHAYLKDPVGLITSFKAVVLEGLEVVFIVIATGGAAGSLWPAIAGASLAGVGVLALGLILHRPLARVPENKLKFAVGVLLTAFGIFWVGEGRGDPWPGDDLVIFILVAGIFLISLGAVQMAKRRRIA